MELEYDTLDDLCFKLMIYASLVRTPFKFRRICWNLLEFSLYSLIFLSDL